MDSTESFQDRQNTWPRRWVGQRIPTAGRGRSAGEWMPRGSQHLRAAAAPATVRGGNSKKGERMQRTQKWPASGPQTAGRGGRNSGGGEGGGRDGQLHTAGGRQFRGRARRAAAAEEGAGRAKASRGGRRRRRRRLPLCRGHTAAVNAGAGNVRAAGGTGRWRQRRPRRRRRWRHSVMAGAIGGESGQCPSAGGAPCQTTERLWRRQQGQERLGLRWRATAASAAAEAVDCRRGARFWAECALCTRRWPNRPPRGQ